MRTFKKMTLLFFLVAAVVGVAQFTASNGQPVDLNLAGMTRTDVPLYLVVFASFAVGVGLSLFFWLFEMLRSEGRRRALRKENRALSSEIEALKRVPLRTGSAPPTERSRA